MKSLLRKVVVIATIIGLSLFSAPRVSTQAESIDVSQADLLVVDSSTRKLYGIDLTQALKDGNSENAVVFSTPLYDENGYEITASPLGVAYEPTYYSPYGYLYVSFDNNTIYKWDRSLNFVKKVNTTRPLAGITYASGWIGGITEGDDIISAYSAYSLGLGCEVTVERPSDPPYTGVFYNLNGITKGEDSQGNPQWVVTSSDLKSISTTVVAPCGGYVVREAPFQHGSPDAITSFLNPGLEPDIFYIRSGNEIYRTEETSPYDSVLMVRSDSSVWYDRYWGVIRAGLATYYDNIYYQTVWKYKPEVQKTAAEGCWMYARTDADPQYFDNPVSVGLYEIGDFDQETVSFREFPESIQQPGYVQLRSYGSGEGKWETWPIDFTKNYLMKPYDSSCRARLCCVDFGGGVFYDKNSEAMWFGWVHYELHPDLTNQFTLPSEITSPEDIEVIKDVDVIELHGKITDGHGHPLSNVKLTLTWDGNQYIKYTDTSGDYFFPQVTNLDINSGREGKITITLEDRGEDTTPYIRVFREDPLTLVDATTKTFSITSSGDLERDIDFSYDPNKIGDTSLGLDVQERNKLADYAAFYYYTYQALSFAREVLSLNLDHPQLPVDILGWATSGTRYSAGSATIFIDKIDSEYDNGAGGLLVKGDGRDMPDNREFHEFSHHIMTDSIIGGNNALPPDGPGFSDNHDGIINGNSADSWVEGFAEFMSMVISEVMLGDSTPFIYTAKGNNVNLEHNYRVNYANYEEVAIAGILWDLYDGIDNVFDNDSVDLTLQQIWNVLNQNTAAGTGGNRNDLKDVYDAFVNSGIAVLTQDADGDGINNLDEIFISHGVYNDVNGSNTYNPGEAVGITSWNPLYPNRRNMPPPDGGYLLLTAIDNMTDQSIDRADFRVEIKHDPPYNVYDYSFVIEAGNLPRKVAFIMTPYPATATIKAIKEGYMESDPIQITSSFYWDSLSQIADGTIVEPPEYLLSHTFYLTSLPTVQYDLSISSTEGGSVTTPGEGIFIYDEGTVVDLVAEADQGYQFFKWTGDVGTVANVNAGITSIIMNDDYSISANFRKPTCGLATAADGVPIGLVSVALLGAWATRRRRRGTDYA